MAAYSPAIRHIAGRRVHTFNVCLWRSLNVPWSKLLMLGDGRAPPLIGNPYNGYINPYYWLDDHPLLCGNHGSLDPGTYEETSKNKHMANVTHVFLNAFLAKDFLGSFLYICGHQTPTWNPWILWDEDQQRSASVLGQEEFIPKQPICLNDRFQHLWCWNWKVATLFKNMTTIICLVFQNIQQNYLQFHCKYGEPAGIHHSNGASFFNHHNHRAPRFQRNLR